jgi:hypothetical protein
LRQSVLEDHGWIIHRIWSTDWFQRPVEQLERTIKAIEAAKTELDARSESNLRKQFAVPVEVVTIDRGDVIEIGLSDVGSSDSRSYIEATPVRPGPYEIHETPSGAMADLIEQVVQVESPIHVDELIVRLRTAWGLQRAGGRIEAVVEQGIRLALTRGRLKRDGSFLLSIGVEPIPRDRTTTRSLGLRKPEMISPAEIAAGIFLVVSANLGATDEEIILAVSRQLGFKATSALLRGIIGTVINNLVAGARLNREHNMVVMPSGN